MSGAVPPQLSFSAIFTEAALKSVSWGSASGSATPKGVSAGPMARMTTDFGAVPRIVKPTVRPVPMGFRTETLSSRGVVRVKVASGAAS